MEDPSRERRLSLTSLESARPDGSLGVRIAAGAVSIGKILFTVFAVLAILSFLFSVITERN